MINPILTMAITNMAATASDDPYSNWASQAHVPVAANKSIRTIVAELGN